MFEWSNPMTDYSGALDRFGGVAEPPEDEYDDDDDDEEEEYAWRTQT